MWRDRQRELAHHIGLETHQLFPHQRQDMYVSCLLRKNWARSMTTVHCRHHLRHVHKKRIESRMGRARMRQKRVMKGLRAELLQGSLSDVMYSLQVYTCLGSAPCPALRASYTWLCLQAQKRQRIYDRMCYLESAVLGTAYTGVRHTLHSQPTAVYAAG